jgi:STE24 endopeptidase
MFLTLLLCLLILYVPLSVEPADWPRAAFGVAALAAANAALCWVAGRLALRLPRRSGALAAPDGLGRLLATRRTLSLARGLVVGFVAADVFLFHWPDVVYQLVGRHPWAVLVDDLLLLTPALVMLVSVMALQHRLEGQVGGTVVRARDYVSLRLRIELGLLLVPWTVLVLVTDVAAALWHGSPHAEAADAVATVGTLGGLVVFSPALLRLAWRARPMPPGSLRSHLMEFCREHSFRCRDVLLWDTRDRIANAAVVGPTPLLRYVLLTDALVARCSESEVEAVFAHELGHIRHHHMGFYLVFGLAFVCFYANAIDLLAAFGLTDPLDSLLGFGMESGHAVALLVLAAAYWGALFGFVSRRLELEADLYSLQTSSVPGAFIGALQVLGTMNPMPRRFASWRHFGIAQRTAFLERCLVDPAYVRRFKRRLALLRGAILGLFAAALARLVLLRPELFGT